MKAPNTKLPIQPPWVAIMKRPAEIARGLATELVLLPAQRGRAGMAPADDPAGLRRGALVAPRRPS